MELEVVRLFLFGVLLALGAEFDLKRKEIPDLVSACLWIAAMLSLDSGLIQATAFSFATLFLINTVFFHVKGKSWWGWGDLLLFPPFFGQLYAFGQPILATMAFLAPMLIGGHFKREEEPVGPYLFIAFLLGVGLAYVWPLISMA